MERGDYGETAETAKGEARRGRSGSRTYFSVFGRITVSRYPYHTDKETFAPSDIFLNLPIRRYSYFLSEMMNLPNIRGAYSEGAGFIKKFFGTQVSVSASETISDESSVHYKDYHGIRDTPEKPEESDEKKDFTAVSFDGKGVPMIKKEAAKIIGRKGKGRKRQKKKEALAGVRYVINANIRTADDVAKNPVCPDQKKENGNGQKQERACHIRYISGIAKPENEVMNEICEEVRNEDFGKTPPLCLTDGSSYLRSQLKAVFRDIENKVCIPDIIHVSEHIWLIAHVMHREGSDNAKACVSEKLRLVLKGNISAHIMELRTEMLNGKWKKASHQEKFRKVITYFKNHRYCGK